MRQHSDNLLRRMGRTDARTHGRTDGRTGHTQDNINTQQACSLSSFPLASHPNPNPLSFITHYCIITCNSEHSAYHMSCARPSTHLVVPPLLALTTRSQLLAGGSLHLARIHTRGYTSRTSLRAAAPLLSVPRQPAPMCPVIQLHHIGNSCYSSSKAKKRSPSNKYPTYLAPMSLCRLWHQYCSFVTKSSQRPCLYSNPLVRPLTIIEMNQLLPSRRDKRGLQRSPQAGRESPLNLLLLPTPLPPPLAGPLIKLHANRPQLAQLQRRSTVRATVRMRGP